MLSTVFESIQGRQVRIARAGAGPPLVLLHGYPDNLQIWQEVVPRLARRFQVLAFDWPGMGYSQEWPGGATPELMADRLATLLDHWQIEKAFVIGMDMGGQPALVFASRYAQRTTALSVMNCLAYHDEPTSWEISVLRKFGWNRWILRHLPSAVFRRALRTFLPANVSLASELRSDLWNSFHRPEVRRFISKMCAGYQGTLPRLPEMYASVQAPTLILWAEQDKHFPLQQASRLHAAIGNSRLKILAGAEHWMVLDRAADIAAAILEFSEQSGL